MLSAKTKPTKQSGESATMLRIRPPPRRPSSVNRVPRSSKRRTRAITLWQHPSSGDTHSSTSSAGGSSASSTGGVGIRVSSPPRGSRVRGPSGGGVSSRGSRRSSASSRSVSSRSAGSSVVSSDGSWESSGNSWPCNLVHDFLHWRHRATGEGRKRQRCDPHRQPPVPEMSRHLHSPPSYSRHFAEISRDWFCPNVARAIKPNSASSIQACPKTKRFVPPLFQHFTGEP